MKGMSRSDSEALNILAKALKASYVDPLDEIFRCVRQLPPEWRQKSTGELVRAMRDRLEMTQRQLALLAGVPHSKIAKIEKGQDIQLRTLRQVFAGFGCTLIILPFSPLSARQLWRRTDLLWEAGCIPRRRRYPRK